MKAAVKKLANTPEDQAMLMSRYIRTTGKVLRDINLTA